MHSESFKLLVQTNLKKTRKSGFLQAEYFSDFRAVL